MCAIFSVRTTESRRRTESACWVASTAAGPEAASNLLDSSPSNLDASDFATGTAWSCSLCWAIWVAEIVSLKTGPGMGRPPTGCFFVFVLAQHFLQTLDGPSVQTRRPALGLTDLRPRLFQRLVLEVVPLQQPALFVGQLFDGSPHPV